MRGTGHVVAACALVLACACGTGDTRIDPGDLELRDLLGVSPEAAGRWDGTQRASARRVLEDALVDVASEPIRIGLANGESIDEQIARSLASLDAKRFADGDAALGLVRVTLDGAQLTGATRAAPTLRILGDGTRAEHTLQLEMTETWRALPQLSHQVITVLATDAGAQDGDRVFVIPAPRLPVVASFVATTPPRMLVNPVLLAALDPGALALAENPGQAGIAVVAPPGRRQGDVDDTKAVKPGVLAAGNPYSFYGSVAECAYAERSRCQACVAANDCTPITTTSDGNAECAALDADGGRGYFLMCINLALAISSVEDCTADLRPSCARDTDAASSLSQLEANAVFLDDASCGTGLDACLAKIYGEPAGEFPGPTVDGGVVIDPPDPPRDIDVSCGDSCDGDKSSNCEFSPNCSCEGPSCGNSFSCDSSCSSSNNQSGCGDNCDSCSSDSGGGGGGGGGSCGGDSGGGGGGGDCGGGDCNSGGDCGNSDCGGGDCGGDCNSDCGGGDGGGGDCGGGGGGGCQVVKRPPSAVFAVALSLTWALLPVPLAAFMRRRAKRRAKAAKANEEVQS